MNTFRLHWASSVVAIVLLPSGTRSVSAQLAPSDSSILAILKTRVDSGRAPGIIVGILEQGRRRYVAYGVAGPGAAPLGEHTVFEIGSISKTFTGLLLAEAVVRGEVRLDEPVAELLPKGTVVPTKDGKPITLEQLSTHRSGLPRLPTNLAPANMADPYADYNADRLYAFLSAYALPRAPGDSAEYSNLGGGLLGHALSLRAGMPSWGALVEQRIAGPLGLRETFVEIPAALQGRLATGHDERMVEVSAWRPGALAGAYALHSTAADMLSYLGAALDTVRGPLHQALALSRTPRADFAPGSRIALGWMVSGPSSHPVWWHNGGTGGFRSFAAFDPARHIGVVVLANSAVSVDDIGMHLMNPVVPLAMPMLPPRTVLTLSGEALDRLVGEYAVTPMMRLTITREGNNLFGQASGQSRFPLTATAADRFVFPPAGIELTFDLSEAGPARRLILRQGGGSISADRHP
jgi:D-alanyl-D-alanine-carboxypeptidase/D-alanyl-D-alanine-endopeptidase